MDSGYQLYKMFLRKFVIFLLYLLATKIVLITFITRPGINGNPPAMFPDMVYGKAHKPYVYRTLLPTTVRIASEVTPEGVKNWVVQSGRIRLLRAPNWEIEYMYEYFIALIIMFCCFLGFAFTLRCLTKLFYDFPSFVADLAPVGGLLIVPIFFKYYSYIYDPCTLFLFTLAIIFITKRKLLSFYVVFLLATLNKETSILLLGIFFVREFKVMRNLGLAGHLLLQMSAWIAIKASIMTIFKNNQGSLIEFHLIDHNLYLISNSVTSPGCLYDLLCFVGQVLIFWALIRPGWTEKPIFLRYGLSITLIALILPTLFFGFIDEMRDYYEAFPFLFLLLLPTIVDIFGLTHNDTRGDIPKRSKQFQ